MALEAMLTELISALKENTAAHKGAAGKAPTATTTKPATTKPGVDAATLKALAVKVMDTKGKPFAKKLIKDVGGAVDLANVKPEKFAALFTAFEAAMNATEETAEEAGEADDEL